MLAVGVADGLNHFFETRTGKAATKMVEKTQVQQVTTKDPKKLEHGKRLVESEENYLLVEYNSRKREEMAQLKAKS